MMEIGGGKMNGKSLVEMKIPVEEVENVDALVSEGYYRCRSDAIRDIIRRGAAHFRSRYWCVKNKRR
jgi:metal-responsive CopG/Arc/MetJ family transcriptional regulator